MPGRGPLMETASFITRERPAANSVVILELEGSLDMTTVETFETRLKELAAQGKSRVGTLMFFLKRFRNVGGDIKIADANPGVYRIFDLMGLPNIFQITESVEDALKAFGGRAHGNVA
jgi:anti-anti-sigma regulatory factor